MNSRSWLRVAIQCLFVSMIAGCGAATAYQRGDEVEPERDDPAALEAEQTELDARLSEELARPEPNCDAACDLSSRICELGQRICGIASRHQEDAELGQRCTDARGRCDAGREHVAARCTCE